MTENNGSKVRGILIILAIILILIVIGVSACRHYAIWHPFDTAYKQAFDMSDSSNGIQYRCELEGELYRITVQYEDDFSVVTVGTVGQGERKAGDAEKYDLPFEESELDAHNEGINEANAFLETLVPEDLEKTDAKEIDAKIRDFFESRGGTVTIDEQVGTPLPEE